MAVETDSLSLSLFFCNIKLMSYREASFHLAEQKEHNIRESKKKRAQIDREKERERVKKFKKTNVRTNMHECVKK